MNVGIDVGYSAVKIVNGTKSNQQITFPSVVGTPDQARFSLNGHEEHDIILDLPGDGTWLVGEGAVAQSRFVDRREDRGWIQSDAYYRLLMAAFTELTKAQWVDLVVVTGLPVAFYSDKDTLRDRFLGQHRATRSGRRAQQFRVIECRVIPQPFGALLAEALDDQGRIADQELATGAVGVIDVGGKTTNLLSVERLAEIGRETASVDLGAWDIVRAVRRHLTARCPNLELRDHQIVEVISQRQVRYYGEQVDLSDAIDAILEPMASQVVAQATQLWNGGASLNVILVPAGRRRACRCSSQPGRLGVVVDLRIGNMTNMTGDKKTLLLVDDDIDLLSLLRNILKPAYQVVMATSAAQALGELRRAQAINQYAEDFITKPFDVAEFLARINRIMQRLYPRSKIDDVTLTPRQQQILELIGQGYTDNQIALCYSISVNTVKKHVGKIHRALNARSRSQAVMVASQIGLLGSNKRSH